MPKKLFTTKEQIRDYARTHHNTTVPIAKLSPAGRVHRIMLHAGMDDMTLAELKSVCQDLAALTAINQTKSKTYLFYAERIQLEEPQL